MGGVSSIMKYHLGRGFGPSSLSQPITSVGVPVEAWEVAA